MYILEQDRLLGELIVILDQSAIAYQRYLQMGKTYYGAQELKIYNNKALKLLTENKYLFREEVQEDIQSLITHYCEWSEKWEKHAAERNFLPGEVFAFENESTFPRQAARNLENAYRNK